MNCFSPCSSCGYVFLLVFVFVVDKQGITTQQLEELTLKAFEKVFGKINESGLKHIL